MRIFVGSLTYPLGNGVTTSINTSLDGFKREGHDMVVIGPRYDVGQVRPEHYPVSASPVGDWFLSALHKKEQMFGLSAKRQIKDLVSHLKPDAFWLHTLTWSENAFEDVMKKSGKPCVLTYHTLVEDYGRAYAGDVGAAVMKRRSKTVSNQMNAVITPSRAVAKRLTAYGVTRPIYVIPTGVTTPEKLLTREELVNKFNLNPANKILLYVGRVSKEKNIETLVKCVLPQLRTKEAVLLLVGPGDLEEMKEIAKKLNVEKQIVCSGSLSKEDAQATYGGGDVFVFASQTETQGLVIGEAMLSNLPVVALDSPIQEEVYPETTAYVAKNPKDFSIKLAEALSNKKKTARLAKAGKEFVEKNFSTAGMIRKQINVFEQLIGE